MSDLQAFFYRTELGCEPVRDFITSLGKAAKVLIGGDIRTLQMGWPLGMPLCKSLGDGLFEIRTALHDGRIVRVLFLCS